MPPGPEKGPAVHDEDQHGAEWEDDQPDQPGHRGAPREASGGRGGCRDGKKGTGHTLDAQASSTSFKKRCEQCWNFQKEEL